MPAGIAFVLNTSTDLSDPTILFYIRGVYAVGQVAACGVLVYMWCAPSCLLLLPARARGAALALCLALQW